MTSSRRLSEATACVIGTGSIGMRHLRNLHALGVRTSAVSRSRKQLPAPFTDTRCHPDLASALKERPNLVVIATPTSEHQKDLELLAEYEVPTLVEKPLCADLRHVSSMVRAWGPRLMVAYNYRFHDALIALKQALAAGSVGRPLTLHAHVGQYLPDWHPDEDYRQSYVSRSELGGGVTRTLSHEIDDVDWLLDEDPLHIQATVAQVSDLELDVDDVSSITLRYPSSLATITLNMVQRHPGRTLTIHGTEATLAWNDMERTITRHHAGGQERIWAGTGQERDVSFQREVEAALDFALGGPRHPSFGDPFRTMRLVDLALESSASRRSLNWEAL